MKINLIDFILGKFKSLKNDIKLLEKNKANNIDLELLRGYNISSYEFLIAEGYPLELATYKENVEDGANSNKRYINIDKDISKVTVGTDIIISFIYEKNGEKKIYQKFEKYSTDRFIDTIQLPFIEGNPSIQISLYKNKQYNKNFEQVDSNKCSILLNYGKKEADIIDEIDEVYFKISIRDRNVLTKDNALEYTPTGDYHPATKKYVDDNILLEQLPILRVDETNKRIYVNCNNMGTYKKYFVPNKYANVYGFSFIYTNEDKSETEIALIGGAMTRDDFILCTRNTDTLFVLILGGTNKYTYTKSTKTLEKGLYGYLKIGNTQEYIPTENYHPSTKKYVDDSLNNMFTFNENGELVVTINGVSKTFVPKE